MDRLAALAKLRDGVANTPPPRLLASHRSGEPEQVIHLPLQLGFLQLVYDDDGRLQLIAFVLDDDEGSTAIGPRLELRGGEVTFIEENGVSGLQWSGGAVRWGHTYDDCEPTPGQPLGLGEWIDERARQMVNPGRDVIDPLAAAERERRALPSIAALLRGYRRGRGLHDLLSKDVATREEIDLLADAVQRGLTGKDAHLATMAASTLGASRVDSAYALGRLTDCLEWAIENGQMGRAESISFVLDDYLRRADAPTLARLRRLAPRLDNECLARGLEALRPRK